MDSSAAPRFDDYAPMPTAYETFTPPGRRARGNNGADARDSSARTARRASRWVMPGMLWSWSRAEDTRWHA